MPLAKPALAKFTAKHPQCEQLFSSFIPLLEAQEQLADSLPPLELPVFDETMLAEGRPWLEGHLPALLDEPFLEKGPAFLAAAVGCGFPAIRNAAAELGAFLTANPGACRELVEPALSRQLNKVRQWAAAYKQDETAATVMASHLAGTAARRAARAAASLELSFSGWVSPLCPICGSRPHGASLREKEGQRFLQCSLCRHEWRFSRTTCPACLQDSPQEIDIYYVEGTKQMRAELCKCCNHYLLCVDPREFIDNLPIEVYLLCMMPLDLLMQEKKCIPIPMAKKKMLTPRAVSK